jgi:ABC-type dipeptide/oligopeptide/nickel transport system permease component
MGIFVLTGVLTLAGIMITDILYTWADPRISFDSKNH